MSTEPIPTPFPPPDEPPEPAPHAPHTGRLVLGAFLVLLGTGWLLETTGVVEFPWDTLLPAALIVVGIALVAASRSGRSQGGLVTFGVILTVLLTIGTAIDLPFGGGVGERLERPNVPGEHRYELALGSMTVDLTEIGIIPLDAQQPGTHVDARVGMGQLVVLVHRGALARVDARAGVGEVTIFGQQRGGIDVHNVLVPKVPLGTEIRFSLTLSVGIGQVEVRYA